ncbi:MAG: sugar phosphate nucleotidyltransferase [Candidatus Hydrogenedentes bacterium]|nr:sugar phosphate nucleotidyltransferase [Candidatus Hydrogenedentota bacterium]
MKVIIMAAGKSTRTYPLTLTRPKPLIKVANKPILAHQLDALRGIADGIILVVGYRAEMIREAFGGTYDGMPIEYVVQAEQRGTGHAILQCAQHVDGPFLAMNGDDLYDSADLANVVREQQAALAMTVADPRLYGVYEVADGNRAVRLVEKPTEVFSHLANIGVYRFTPEVFDVLRHTEPSVRGEIEITSAVQTLAERGVFRVVETVGYWLPIGYPWHLLDANAFMLKRMTPRIEGEVHPAAILNGPVTVGKGTVIHSGVVIDGPVCIGENCQIGPNCCLRPGTAIGNGCRIGPSVEIKNSIFMDRAFACHLSYIGDSVVGEHANLGCGTVTSNVRHDGGYHRSMVNGVLIDTGRKKLGAVIGDEVHTGIHTAIYPGRKIWPGATTLPGEVVARDIVT